MPSLERIAARADAKAYDLDAVDWTRGLDPELPAMKALGAAELMAHLRGELSLEEASELARKNTRHFAKRQLTWFRNQAADWPRASDAASALDVVLT